MQLYYAPPSIYGRKVLAVLHEKNLDFEIKLMSFQEGDHKKSEYLKLNPNGEIPTLIDDSFIVYESTAIMEYLNDEYPEPLLMPEDSEGKARVRMIDDFCDLHLYPTLVRILLDKLAEKETAPQDRESLQNHLRRLEAYLGNQNFIAGEFSLADCSAMAGFATLEWLGFGDLINHSKTLPAYVKRLKTRAGYNGAAYSLKDFPEPKKQS